MTDNTYLTLNIELDMEKFKSDDLMPEVIQILKHVRPSWSVKDIRCKVFNEGICNTLKGYYEVEKFEKDVVLIRVNGEDTELVLDRTEEIKCIQLLSEKRFCAPLYCAFGNGIAYGFVHGETLDINNVRDKKIRRLVAKEMCKMHAIKEVGEENKPVFVERLQIFLDTIPDHYDDAEQQARYVSSIPPKSQLRKEYFELKAHLDALGCNIVLSHNDLLVKNIVYDESKDRVAFIDFETAMLNYQPYDIGNHFCEYAGVHDIDFSKYPDKDYQLEWIRYYLECWEEENGRINSIVTDKEVEKWYVLVNKFSLMAHLFCAFWGLIQVKYSSKDFDYLSYAKVRLDEYFSRKEELLALEVPS